MPKLQELTQTHGKLPSDTRKPRTLAQVWGDKGLNKYHTTEVSEYEGYLKELNKTDLQAHAITVGLLPMQKREILVARLLKEFRNHFNSYNVPQNRVSSVQISSEALKILAQGK